MRDPDGSSFSTKGDRVASIIRNKITLGEYAPGQRLLQQQLAAEIGVSETPVREALNQLRAEGLVAGEPHHGARVADFPLQTVRETCLIRLTLERLAISEAMRRIGPDEIAAVEQAHQRMREAAQRGDRAATIHHNRAFHLAIYEASGMPQLTELIRMMWSRLPPGSTMFNEKRLPEVLREHGAVVDALLAGQRGRAGEQMERHVQVSLELLQHSMEQH